MNIMTSITTFPTKKVSLQCKQIKIAFKVGIDCQMWVYYAAPADIPSNSPLNRCLACRTNHAECALSASNLPCKSNIFKILFFHVSLFKHLKL